MENLVFILQEQEDTDWVNSMVVAEKPKRSERLCIDPRYLNAAIRRSPYQMKTVEEVARRLKVLISIAYWIQRVGFGN